MRTREGGSALDGFGELVFLLGDTQGDPTSGISGYSSFGGLALVVICALAKLGESGLIGSSGMAGYLEGVLGNAGMDSRVGIEKSCSGARCGELITATSTAGVTVLSKENVGGGDCAEATWNRETAGVGSAMTAISGETVCSVEKVGGGDKIEATPECSATSSGGKETTATPGEAV